MRHTKNWMNRVFDCIKCVRSKWINLKFVVMIITPLLEQTIIYNYNFFSFVFSVAHIAALHATQMVMLLLGMGMCACLSKLKKNVLEHYSTAADTPNCSWGSSTAAYNRNCDNIFQMTLKQTYESTASNRWCTKMYFPKIVCRWMQAIKMHQENPVLFCIFFIIETNIYLVWVGLAFAACFSLTLIVLYLDGRCFFCFVNFWRCSRPYVFHFNVIR